MAEDAKTLARNWPWSLMLALGLYLVANELAQHFGSSLRFPSDGPGDEPPWYFLRRDAIEGFVFLAYLLICVPIGLVAIRKKFDDGWLLILFALVWSSLPVWDLLVIYQKSDNLFDPERATTSWSTFDSYLNEPLREYGSLIAWVALAVFLVQAVVWGLLTWRRQRAAEGSA